MPLTTFKLKPSIFWLLGFALQFAVAANSYAENRLALVIGNANYQSAGDLKNPANDARAIAAKLKTLGFTLLDGKAHIDKTRYETNRLIKAFGQKLRRGDTAFFYYAGHGIGGDGTNYIIPVDDAPIEFFEDLPEFAVNIGSVLRRMEQRGDGINVVILDACRNSPLQSRTRNSMVRGLRRMPAPRGTFIGYAASVGQQSYDGTGNNGVFTEQFLKVMDKPNLSLSDMFADLTLAVEVATDQKQLPMRESNISGRFYLAGDRSTAFNGNVNTNIGLSSAESSFVNETKFWMRSKCSATNNQTCKDYLRRYPKGEFANLARLYIKTGVSGNAVGNSSASANSKANASETKLWLFPMSSKELIPEHKLRFLSKEELWEARNEIFARHGYVFKTVKGKQYAKSLGAAYSPTNRSSSQVYAGMNAVEKQNISNIKRYE